jgi:two-component system, chemotaxis family, CheB/CheR fusion protein
MSETEIGQPRCRAAHAALIVGIGASAGGLQAKPADTGMAFVLIQHLDPQHKTMLVVLVESTTNAMPVVEAAESTPVAANCHPQRHAAHRRLQAAGVETGAGASAPPAG